MNDDNPEYDYRHCNDKLEVPKIPRFDIFWRNKLEGENQTNKIEDKKYLKVDTLSKDHEDWDQYEP